MCILFMVLSIVLYVNYPLVDYNNRMFWLEKLDNLNTIKKKKITYF